MDTRNPLQQVIHSCGTFTEAIPPEKPSSRLHGTDASQIMAGVARLVYDLPEEEGTKTVDHLLAACTLSELHHLWHACKLTQTAAHGLQQVLEAHVLVRDSSATIDQLQVLIATLGARHE